MSVSSMATIAQWNLARFAETLLPLLDPNPERAVELANEAISTFTARFQEHWLAGMRNKLGLSSNEEGELELAHALLRVAGRLVLRAGSAALRLRDQRRG